MRKTAVLWSSMVAAVAIVALATASLGQAVAPATPASAAKAPAPPASTAPAPSTGAAASPKKISVPDAAALKNSLKLVNDIYKDDLAKARSAEQKQALAKAMVVTAGAEKEAAGRFALLTSAMDLAAGAATYRLPDAPVDLVTFFYALTMIPAWQAAIDNAWSMPKPGGCLGVVDFYTSQPHPSGAMLRHSRFARRFWPAWFKRGGVFISPDHLPHLQQRFCQVQLFERRAKLPYLPFLRVPYYAFLGRKR